MSKVDVFVRALMGAEPKEVYVGPRPITIEYLPTHQRRSYAYTPHATAENMQETGKEMAASKERTISWQEGVGSGRGNWLKR